VSGTATHSRNKGGNGLLIITAAVEPKVVEVPFGTSIPCYRRRHASISLKDADLRGVVVSGAEVGALPVPLLDIPAADPIEGSWSHHVGSSIGRLLLMTPPLVLGRWSAVAI